jgi:signal peptidase
MKQRLPIPLLILTVYAVVNIIAPFVFRGEMIFLFDAALWTIVVISTVLISKHQQVNIWRTNKTLVQMAAVIAIFQITLGIFPGFFLGFGKNANTWTPTTLAVYFPYLLMPLLGTEVSRAFLAQGANRRKPTAALLLTSLLYTLIGTSPSGYMSLVTPIAISEFLIRTFIPTLAVSLLATYLAFSGGFSTSLVYMLATVSFTWFSPILPNVPWAAQSMMTVIGTAIGFVMVDSTAKLMPRALLARPRRILTRPKPQLINWTTIALIGLVTVWSSTGLLGFTPTIVGSGSMTPTLNVGDVALIMHVPVQSIKVGDVIQYQTADMTVLHRVVDEHESGGLMWFTTKGDANNAPDTPVNEQQVLGKEVLIIPQVGWISTSLKELAAKAYDSMTTHLPQTVGQMWALTTADSLYLTLGLTVVAYSFLLSMCKDRAKRMKLYPPEGLANRVQIIKSLFVLASVGSLTWFAYWIGYDMVVWSKPLVQVNPVNYAGAAGSFAIAVTTALFKVKKHPAPTPTLTQTIPDQSQLSLMNNSPNRATAIVPVALNSGTKQATLIDIEETHGKGDTMNLQDPSQETM